jgi:DNA (cytosine-5)-methyltransferase 1
MGGHLTRSGDRSGELLLPGVAKSLALLPTPRVTQPGYADDGRGGKSLDVEARLLPTPTSQAAKHSGGDTDRGPGSPDDANLWTVAQRDRWGDYAAAIARWETVLGRPAPAPTMTSAKGNPQLSPRFVEWMMGLPAGWVTDVPGITRNEALKALGNGVVPQQCAAALRLMLGQAVAA